LLLKKVKNVTKKEKFFLFLKNLSVLFVKLLPFREQKKSRQLLPFAEIRPGPPSASGRAQGNAADEFTGFRLKHMGFQAAEGLRKAFSGLSGNVREIHVSSPEGCTQTRTLPRPPV